MWGIGVPAPLPLGWDNINMCVLRHLLELPLPSIKRSQLSSLLAGVMWHLRLGGFLPLYYSSGILQLSGKPGAFKPHLRVFFQKMSCTPFLTVSLSPRSSENDQWQNTGKLVPASTAGPRRVCFLGTSSFLVLSPLLMRSWHA